MMRKVKITVIKVYFFPELANAYLKDGESVGPCPYFKKGDVFYWDGSDGAPIGKKEFCPWARNDIRRAMKAIYEGFNPCDWYNQEHMEIECCNDGIRPVVFKLEAVEE